AAGTNDEQENESDQRHAKPHVNLDGSSRASGRAKAPASRTHSKRFATKNGEEQSRASVCSASGLPALSLCHADTPPEKSAVSTHPRPPSHFRAASSLGIAMSSRGQTSDPPPRLTGKNGRWWRAGTPAR